MNSSIFNRRRAWLVVASLALSGAASAQSREPGWETGLDLVYQDGKTMNFDGGTSVSLDDDFGLSLTFGYRFSPRLELQMALDYSKVDYDADLALQGGGTVGVSGTMEVLTPRADIHFNLIDGPITPYVQGGIGYSWIDTNIPNGRPSTGCWWDPWYGYICTSVQATKGLDGFTYDVGVGVRWDVSPIISLRMSLEKHWIDLRETKSVDQIKAGFVWRPF